MIREPYNLNPYNSTIDTSKVNNFSFTFSGDELGSWNIEIAKNNTSPEIVYTSEEFVPEDVGYSHIYDGDIVEGITLPSTIAHSQGDDGLLRRLYSINGYPFDEAVVKLNVNGIENIGNIKGSTANGYLVATNYSLGRTGDGVAIIGFDKDGTIIGSQVADGTYDFLGYLLSVKTNSNIQVGQVVQIEGNSFIIGSIEDVGDGYSELTIVNGEVTFSDTASIVSFDSLAEADVTELTVGIEPVQDLSNGDPSPTNICPITGHDEVAVTRTGKNQLSFGSSGSKNNLTFTVNDDGSVTVSTSGNVSGSSYYVLGSASIKANTQYVLSGCLSDGGQGKYGLGLYDSSANLLATDFGSGATYTPTEDMVVTCGIRYWYGQACNGTFYPQLELGSTATAYEPYRSNTYTTSLGQTVYGGTLDVVSGVLTVDKAMVDLGSLTWLLNSSLNGKPAFYVRLDDAKTVSASSVADMTTSCYSVISADNLYIQKDSTGIIALNGQNYLQVRDTRYSTASAYKSGITGQTLVYELATPLTYTLTAQQIKTLVGTNNVWASSGDIVSIKLKYNIN